MLYFMLMPQHHTTTTKTAATQETQAQIKISQKLNSQFWSKKLQKWNWSTWTIHHWITHILNYNLIKKLPVKNWKNRWNFDKIRWESWRVGILYTTHEDEMMNTTHNNTGRKTTENCFIQCQSQEWTLQILRSPKFSRNKRFLFDHLINFKYVFITFR